MAEENRIRGVFPDFPRNALRSHRSELRIEQPDLVSGIEQWSPQSQQAERRQMLLRNAAADRGMRRVDEKDSHSSRRGLISEFVANVLIFGFRVLRSLCITKYMTNWANKLFKTPLDFAQQCL